MSSLLKEKYLNIFYVFNSSRSHIFKKDSFHYLHKTALYGLNNLHEWNINTNYSDYAFNKGLIQSIVIIINRFLNRYKIISFDLSQAIILLPIINKSDIVFTTADYCGLPILYFKMLKLVKPPVVYVSIGLLDRIKFSENYHILHKYKCLFNYASRIITYSYIEKQKLINLLNINNNKFSSVITPGVDIKLFTSSKNKLLNNYVLSIGADSSRDYNTLFEAISCTNIPLIIITFRNNIRNLKIPKNVTVYYGMKYLKTKYFYEKARFIVLPIKENTYSGAFMSAFQAMAMEKAVILSDVSAIRGYHLKHSKNCWIIPNNDKKALMDAISNLWNNPSICKKLGKEARKTVIKYYTYERYCEQLANIFWDVYEDYMSQKY